MKPSGAIRPDYQHAIHHPDGRTELPLIWEGGPLAEVSWGLVHHEVKHYWPGVGDVIQLGPFRVRVVDSDPHNRGRILVCRTGFDSYLLQEALRLWRTVQWVNIRLLWTCQVWELASWQHGQEPRWSDLKVVTSVKRWKEYLYAKLG
jgi:hypothetical protein